MRDLVVASRIGRQNHSDAFSIVGGSPQRNPGARPSHNSGDAFLVAGMDCPREAEIGIGGSTSLNEATPVKMRPSISGRTTWIARSGGDRPRSDSDHPACVEPASATCNTGASTASSGEPAPPSPRAEKAVALTITSGAIWVIQRRSQPSLSGSLRLAANRPNVRTPRRWSSAISLSAGSVSAAARNAR